LKHQFEGLADTDKAGADGLEQKRSLAQCVGEPTGRQRLRCDDHGNALVALGGKITASQREAMEPT
jgi:hypothetical protein